MRLSVLILASEGTGHVFGAIEQVRRGGRTPEIIVACGAAIPEATVRRLATVWNPSGVRVVAVSGATPGAFRNAAVQAATSELILFLEAGDTLAPEYVAATWQQLESRADLSLATAWVRRPGARGLATLYKPVLTLEAALSDRDPLPHPTVFRRAAWDAIGRFDESLPAGEWFDFAIRLFAAGHRGETLEAALIGYAPARDSAYRQSLDPERHAAGIRAVVEKHGDAFRHHLTQALCGREAAMREQAPHYHELVRRRDRLAQERETVSSALQDTLRALTEIDGESVEWGDLRRVLPLSADWGYERGAPIDRYYIERFLASCAPDVQGVVLEIQESDYTKRFGGDRVTRSDVIDIDPGNPRANLTGDLRRLEGIPTNTYDCFILTQTVHVINDMPAVLGEAMRILKPGGVLLVTLPCASRVCLEYGPDGDFWRLTEAGARHLFAAIAPSTHVDVRSYGNVLASTAFLEGIAVEEVSAEELEIHDPFNPMLVSVRAVKPLPAVSFAPRRISAGRAVILLYHRVASPARDIHGLSVRPEDFRAQMSHLAASYHLMPLPQLAAAAREGWLPERAVAVTFDDGYLDNLRVASPILLAHRIPATFFITDAVLDGRTEYWWDALATVFFGSAPLPSRLTLSEPALELPTTSDHDREHAHWILYHRLREAEAGPRDLLLAQVKAWAGVTTADEARPMNRFELEDLARRPGHSIGGHGSDHLSYSGHARDIVRRDVRENRINLEVAVGRIVTSFAYPYGDHDAQCAEIVGELGYRAAVTCVEGLVRPGTDPLRLPRHAVGPGDASGFAERLRAIFAADPPA